MTESGKVVQRWISALQICADALFLVGLAWFLAVRLGAGGSGGRAHSDVVELGQTIEVTNSQRPARGSLANCG